MTFSEMIAPYTVAEIVDALGCPYDTAFQWRSEPPKRSPPKWQWPIFLQAIEAKHGKRVQSCSVVA